jgi:hypothetical protein
MLKGSTTAGDSAQAYYHAINLAFLDLMAAPATAGVPADVRSMAGRALKHCSAAAEDHWRLATEAEAALMMQDLDPPAGDSTSHTGAAHVAFERMKTVGP